MAGLVRESLDPGYGSSSVKKTRRNFNDAFFVDTRRMLGYATNVNVSRIEYLKAAAAHREETGG